MSAVLYWVSARLGAYESPESVSFSGVEAWRFDVGGRLLASLVGHRHGRQPCLAQELFKIVFHVIQKMP